MYRRFGARDVATRLLFFVSAGLVACAPDRGVVPETGTIDVDTAFESADVPAGTASREVSLALRNAAGFPAVGVRVDWVVQDGGSVSPARSFSDSLGRATTTWVLGAGVAQHTIVARAQGFAPRSITSHSPPRDPLPLNQFVALDLSTYDGSGETVHPDYVRTELSSRNTRILAITPYRSGDTQFENPSIYNSPDDVTWNLPYFAQNPVALPTQTHLSDPDIVFEPNQRELYLYFREVGNENTIWLMRSADAVQWTERERVLVAPNHEIVSPTVVRRSETDWLMWTVNTFDGCNDVRAGVDLRRSLDGVSWSAPQRVAIDQPGFMPWHIDVQWIPSRNEYWALYNVKVAGSCSTPALYLATSPDGVTWRTYPSPVLSRGAIPAFADIVYRSTFSYDAAADVVTFWYSGARFDGTHYVWSSVAQRRRRSDLFTEIGAPVGRSVALLFARQVPPLRDPP